MLFIIYSFYKYSLGYMCWTTCRFPSLNTKSCYYRLYLPVHTPSTMMTFIQNVHNEGWDLLLFGPRKWYIKLTKLCFGGFSVFKMAASLHPLYHNIVILGTSLVLGAVHFRHYRRLWMGQWMKKFGLGKKDLYSFPSTSSGVIVSFLLILAVCLMFVMR